MSAALSIDAWKSQAAGLAYRNQAFIDALDSDPATKPYLTIDVYTPVPGDGNEDGVVDLEDHALFTACMGGPGVTAATGCELFLFDPDTDVDLADFKDFQALIPGQS